MVWCNDRSMVRAAGASTERVAVPVAQSVPFALDDGAGADAVLTLSRVTKQWPGAPALFDGIDLEIERRSVLAIHGRNGAGKTTLLRIACGLITADRGTVTLDGFDPECNPTEFRRRIGLVSAGNSGLYARLKTEQHLDMWARLALVPRPQRAGAIQRVVDAFDLGPLCGQRVDRLSMGQRQRLRTALAFLHEPDVVLLDEPTNSLDEDAIALLDVALERLKAAGGAAVVCVPSGSEDIAAIDRRMVLEGGRLEDA